MDSSVLKQQLDKILITFQELRQNSEHSDLSDLPASDRQGLLTRAIAAVRRITGDKSIYSQEIDRTISELPYLHVHLEFVMGVVQALRDDISAGYLQSITELIHADIFSDFLEMASHLLKQGYKDAAAVIAGSTLESHLRKLANKNGLATDDIKGLPLKADRLNADLARAIVYSKLDHKSVTAWLDLRNNAAHGDYNKYKADQVELMISAIQNFIVRNVA
jgi:hypothetical protein